MPVYPIADGVVADIYDPSDNSLHYVIIQHSYNGANWQSAYLHLSSIDVQLFDTVTTDDIIGISGDSGGVPPHLHFEMLSDNPNYGLGERTSIDPFEFFVNTYGNNYQKQDYTFIKNVTESGSTLSAKIYYMDTYYGEYMPYNPVVFWRYTGASSWNQSTMSNMGSFNYSYTFLRTYGIEYLIRAKTHYLAPYAFYPTVYEGPADTPSQMEKVAYEIFGD